MMAHKASNLFGDDLPKRLKDAKEASNVGLAMAFRYGQNYIKYKKTIRSLFELIQVLTQIVNHPYLVSYRVITK